MNVADAHGRDAHATVRARTVLVLFALVAAAGVGITLSPLQRGFADKPSRGAGDFALYHAVADRIHAGETYYQAMGGELRERGYPTQSVFNWRTPLPLALIGKAPNAKLAQAALCAGAMLVLLGGFGLLAREGGTRAALVGGLLLTGALMPACLGELFYEPVLWSGIAITGSILAYSWHGRPAREFHGQDAHATDENGGPRPTLRNPQAYGLQPTAWVLGFSLGLLALFFRELAAPYVMICAAIALREKRWRELGCWAVGLAAYFAFFGWHVWQVMAHRGDAAHAHAEGWLQFGGAAFVISTAQMNAYLVLLPQWATALFLAIALLGFATWNSPAGQRAAFTASAYLAAFACVGHDFNQYWGILIAPLLCLGAGMGVVAVGRLWREAISKAPQFAARLQAAAGQQ